MRNDASTNGLALWLVVAGCALVALPFGCYRPSPPDVPEFKPPPRKVVQQTTEEVVEEAGAPVIEEFEPEPEPEPEAPPTPQAVPVVAAAPPPPVQEATPVPTIVGSWLATGMVMGGQEMPMPPGMQMVLTFSADGTASMTTSGEMMPEPMTQQGTYSVDGNQITIAMEGETKTGAYELSGNTLTLDVEEVALTLTRM